MEDTTELPNPQNDFARRFGWPDYLVFVLMLVSSAAIGVYYAYKGRKSNSVGEMLLASKSMGTFPMAMSLLASFMSAITLLGLPAEIYRYGTMYMMINVSYFLVIPASAYLFLPVFYNLNLTSAYEYLELRFNKAVRLIGSVTFMVQMCLYMAVVVYAPALALSQVTGVDKYLSCSLIFIVCIFYTSLGGMKAVMWTDTLQVTIMFGSIIAVIARGVNKEGSIGAVLKKAIDSDRFEFFEFDPDPTVRHTFWTLTIGGYFTWVAIYGVNQAMVQRYLSVPTLRRAQTALWLNLFGLIGLISICSFAGLVIYAHYSECDPIKAGLVEDSTQLFPYYVMDSMADLPGFPGLFVSGIFSGALSTVSSGINALAAITLEDFVKIWFKDMSDSKAAILSKILTVVFGVICFGLVFVAAVLGSVLQAALSIFGMVGGPLLGLYTLGFFFPWANSTGAICGMIGSFILTFWIGFGTQVATANGQLKPVFKPLVTTGCNITVNAVTSALTSVKPGLVEEPLGLYKVSYLWYSAIGCWMVVVVGLLVSLCTGPLDPWDMNPKLTSKYFIAASNYLPKFLKDLLHLPIGKLSEHNHPRKISLKNSLKNTLKHSGLHPTSTEVNLQEQDEDDGGCSNIAFDDKVQNKL